MKLHSLAAVAWVASVLAAGAADISGTKPGYLLFGVSSVDNEGAIVRSIWAPGLDDGYVPQGIAVDGADVYVSGYQSTDPKVDKGPCRVFRIEAATGRPSGAFDMPADCGHAGGLAWLGAGVLVVADTRRLYRVKVAPALASGKGADGITATVQLTGALKGSFVAYDGKDLWVGSSEKDPAKAALHRLPIDVLADSDGKAVTQERATATLPIPVHAQGAAFDAQGALWVSASNSREGKLYRLDRTTGAVQSTYDVAIGIEDLEFGPDGHLWSVSEAGSQRWIKWRQIFPVVFELDPRKLH